jgi:hypothetical protein
VASLGTPVDIYCERLGPGLWAEPVNALTNLAFLAAAWVGWRAARGSSGAGTDPALAWLVALTVAIGIGSSLFHTFATRWAGLADVLPILAFIVSFLAIAMRRFFGLGWPAAVAIGAAYVPASVALRGPLRDLFGPVLGGSAGYLPAALALLLCGLLLAVRGHPAGRCLLIGAAVFAASLTFRTLDAAVCEAFPLGTHFAWHLLNGVLLGWLLVTLARHGRTA